MLSILDLHNMLINKEITSREITESCISKIERYDSLTNAIINRTFDFALNKADEVDRKIQSGKEISLIAGIPFGVKDSIETKGIVTTAGSRFYELYKPDETAFCVDNLLKNDGVMLAKLNLDEFGVGDMTKSFKFLSKNPFNLNYDASGSSGGSAIFVSAGYGAYSIGTDTGGSVREPAGKTGVVGIKPTYNCISKKNCYGYANSLDTIGSIAGSVLDMAISMEYMTVFDKNDENFEFVDYKDAYLKARQKYESKIKVRVLKEINEIERKTDEMVGYFDLIKELEKSDLFEVETASIPMINKTSALYKVTTAVEGHNQFLYTLNKYHSANKIAEKSLLFDKRVRQRIFMGEYYKNEGQDVIKITEDMIQKLIYEYNQVMSNCDFILTPLTSVKNEQNIVTLGNFTKSPSIALPVGVCDNKVPFGIQIFGKHKKDVDLIRFAYILEQVIKFDKKPTFQCY
ncbi:MAG: amidase [Lachnospirales bacterium]